MRPRPTTPTVLPKISVPVNDDRFQVWAREGYVTGASKRNWTSYGQHVDLNGYGDVERWLLTDPQTSGGLLVTCAPEAVDQVLHLFLHDGFDNAAVIGEIGAGAPRVAVF